MVNTENNRRNNRRAQLCVVLLAAAAAALSAQTKGKWTAPKTPDGQPDLQGVWSSATVTPLERPAELAGKAFLTEAEAKDWERRVVERNNVDNRPKDIQQDVAAAYNNAWFDRGTRTVKTHRTSLIIDPPDGKIPPLTADGERIAAAIAAQRRDHPADGPEDRSLTERCIVWPTAGPPMLPSGYNNNYQIFQAPGYVAIVVEMIHDVRIIPLDGRPHLPSTARQWLGDSRGHWEGNTLVVDTTNFSAKSRMRGGGGGGNIWGPNMHLTERFTRTDADTILYEFTVNDPETYTKPWTAQVSMNKSNSMLYEYACHEGNYGMSGILTGARAQEKQQR